MKYELRVYREGDSFFVVQVGFEWELFELTTMFLSQPGVTGIHVTKVNP